MCSFMNTYLLQNSATVAAKMSKRSFGNTSDTNAKKSKHWSLALVHAMNDPDFVVRKTEHCVVIKDKYPKAKIHYLVLPQDDLSSIFELNKSHISLLEKFNELYQEIQDEVDVKLRAGFHAVPSMQRLHMHIISVDMVSIHLRTKAHWNSFATDFFRSLEDIQEELEDNGKVKRISEELHTTLLATDLQCNQCSYKARNMPKLKEHLLTHIN